MISRRRLTTSVHAMYFLSGAASLILQVVWFKQLQFVLGSSTFSVSVTVASFFFGLSVGSLVGGRLADASPRPLRLYALCEAVLAVLAVAVTAVLAGWGSWAPMLADWLQPTSPARVPLVTALAFATLLPATVMMGASMPLLARWIVDHPDALAARIGHLYAINTLGAAAGCAAVGFAGIGLLGVSGSARAAAACYLLIAGGTFTLTGQGGGHRPDAATDAATGEVDGGVDRPGVLAAVFACSGFVAIAYEVIWFRLLTSYGGQSVFSFAGMLAVYLVGLVAGSVLCARRLAPRKHLLLPAFALVQASIAVASLVSVAVLGRGREIQLVAAHLPFPAWMKPWLGESPEFFVLCAVAVLPPTVLIGLGFPLAAELTVRELSSLSRRLGGLYAANTLGGVLGSLAAGFVLLPLLGSQGAMTLLAATNLVLAGVVVASQSRLRADGVLVRQVAMAGLLAVAGFAVLGPNWLRAAQTAYTDAAVLEFAETPDATYVVLGYPQDAEPFQQVVVNGRSYANNRADGRRYMAALAHLPVLLHEGPRDALVICIGTGTTVGSLSTYDSLDPVTAVDLSAAVYGFAPHFVPRNRRFHENPRVEKVVADGRNFLLTTDRSWDVLTFEPPPPHEAGVVSLYSEEFYRLARQRMRPGGMVAQWVPMNIERREIVWRMLRAMQNTFPHVSLWVSNRKEGIAIGSDHPLQVDVARLASRMAEPDVHEDLVGVGMGEPTHLLSTFVAADEGLRRLVGEGPGLVDDRPTIEYFNFLEIDPILFDEILAGSEPVGPYLKGDVDPGELARSRQVVEAIWREYEARKRGDAAAADEWIAKAEALEPGNRYLASLRNIARTAGSKAPPPPN